MPFVKSCNRFGKKQTAPTVKKTGAKKTAKEGIGRRGIIEVEEEAWTVYSGIQFP